MPEPQAKAARPLRIVQIVENLEIGGLERLVLDLARTQRAQGHDSRIYCVTRPGALAGEAEKAGVPLLAFHKQPGFSSGAVLRIARQLRRDRPSVVHTHNAVIHHYGALAAWLAGVPAVVNTQHGLSTIQHGSRQLRIFRATMPFTDAVVFVSEEAREALQARGIRPRRAEVIQNGIELERLAENPAHPGTGPAVRFGTVGRMVEVKDHATLLRAFALLTDVPGVTLSIVGYGPLEEATRSLAGSLGLSERVIFHSGSDPVPEFLSTLDAFVLSSQSEGMPICVLEAMAAGLPLVSTGVGGIPATAPEGETAWYCPPQDPVALAANLRKAAADRRRLAAMGQRARQIAQDVFSVQAMAAHYQALYQSLL